MRDRIVQSRWFAPIVGWCCALAAIALIELMNWV